LALISSKLLKIAVVFPNFISTPIYQQQHQQQPFNILYEQHLINLRLQGKRPASIDGYSPAVRHNSNYFYRSPDSLMTANLKN